MSEKKPQNPASLANLNKGGMWPLKHGADGTRLKVQNNQPFHGDALALQLEIEKEQSEQGIIFSLEQTAARTATAARLFYHAMIAAVAEGGPDAEVKVQRWIKTYGWLENSYARQLKRILEVRHLEANILDYEYEVSVTQSQDTDK